MMLLLLLSIAAAQVEPPRTVNGAVLGSAADFATRGPAQVCMREIAITAREGEVAYLGYAGIHSGTLRLVIGEKYVDFMHGESWGVPKRELRPVAERSGYRIAREREGKRRYAILVSRPDAPEQEKVLVWISGTAVAGSAGRLGLVDRLRVQMPAATGCQRTYAYGWDMLLGEEPVRTGAKP